MGSQPQSAVAPGPLHTRHSSSVPTQSSMRRKCHRHPHPHCNRRRTHRPRPSHCFAVTIAVRISASAVVNGPGAVAHAAFIDNIAGTIAGSVRNVVTTTIPSAPGPLHTPHSSTTPAPSTSSQIPSASASAAQRGHTRREHRPHCHHIAITRWNCRMPQWMAPGPLHTPHHRRCRHNRQCHRNAIGIRIRVTVAAAIAKGVLAQQVSAATSGTSDTDAEGQVEHQEVLVVSLREDLHLHVAAQLSIRGELRQQNAPIRVRKTIRISGQDVPDPPTSSSMMMSPPGCPAPGSKANVQF